MTMTKRTVETWGASPAITNDTFYYYHRDIYLQTRVREGKTEILAESPLTDGKLTVTRAWVDAAAADEYKTYLEMAAAQNGVELTITVEDI